MAAAFLFIAAFLATLVGTRLLLGFLSRRAILDHPNERSSHAAPTPRGGGIAVAGVIVAAWAGVAAWSEPSALVVCAAAAALAAVSWIDDLRGLAVGIRLVAQAAGVAVVLAAAPERIYFAGLLPPAADVMAAGILWLWFVNLFNFMDGVDGISGVEAASLGLGTWATVAIAALDASIGLYGLAAAGAALGFLRWNWHPARIFLGDVGSVPMGFLLGWLMLELAARGQGVPALILPLYYLADATITLARRALRGEAVWRPHRRHFYQRAVARGLSHAAVAGAVAATNAVLIALAAGAAMGRPGAAVAAAAVVVAALIGFLAAPWARAPSSTP